MIVCKETNDNYLYITPQECISLTSVVQSIGSYCKYTYEPSPEQQFCNSSPIICCNKDLGIMVEVGVKTGAEI